MERECVAYLRVSSDLQIKGNGFERQLKAVGTYAKQNDLRILRVYEEAASGTSQDRPVLQQLLQEDRAKLVLVESADRFSRSCLGGLSHLMSLALAGFDVVDCASGQSLSKSIDGHPIQRFLLNVKFALAQFEKDQIAHRLSEGRRVATEKNGGKYVAGRKSSYDPEFIQKIRKMKRSSMTWAAIAKKLNASGSVTATQLPWTGRRVRAAAKRRT